MVLKDWFEVFIAQNFALDGLLYPVFFETLNDRLNLDYGPTIAMLTRFPREWFADNSKWVDAVIKTAAAESPANRALLSDWSRVWRDRAAAALIPVVAKAFGADAPSVLAEAVQRLDARAKKLGLAVQE